MGRYFTVVAVFILAMTAIASGQDRHRYSRGHWRTVKVYRNLPYCHCGSHQCGTKWWEGGTLHRCRKLH